MPKRTNETPSQHVERVRARVQAYRGHFGELSRCTGIPRPWINQFSQGIFCDPGAGRIETLALAVGLKAHYREVRPAFQPKHRPVDQAATRDAIARTVYGEAQP